MQGYFGKQGYIARFEHDLDVRGEFVPFKETYRRVNGTPWEIDREALATARLRVDKREKSDPDEITALEDLIKLYDDESAAKHCLVDR